MSVGKEYVLEEEMFITHPPQEVFSLLCPVREYEWIRHWRCEMVHSHSGYVEQGCVFTTHFPDDPGGRDTWLTIIHEPHSHVAFVRMNEIRAMRYDIVLSPCDGGTRLTWTQRQYPLSCAAMQAPDAEEYAALVRMLERMLQHYLQTSEMLPV